MKNFAKLIGTMGFLLLVTSIIVLYSDGWRINVSGDDGNDSGDNPIIVKRTGMLAVRSIPETANVYLNDELKTATDDTIASLEPGKYKLRIYKEGFETWEREVEVFSELVTDMTAILILKSPRLDPLTKNDSGAFSLSSNQNNIAFLNKDPEKPGIWILPLAGSPINILSNSSRLFIADGPGGFPSQGEELYWSPNDKEILVKMNQTGYLLYNLGNTDNVNIRPISITNPDIIFENWNMSWKSDFLNSKIERIKSEIKPDEEIIEKLSNTSFENWSPDDAKAYYLIQKGETEPVYDLVVYNSETPLPVGESRITIPIENFNPADTYIYWYSDSYHLVMVERNPETENQYTVSLIRIDGTNKTPIYTGTLAQPTAVPTPGGEKIIVLTSIKQNSPNNLYGVAIR